MLQYNPSISGSLNITGSLIISNGMIGTVNGVDVQIFSSSINQVITGIQAATGSQEGRLGSIESFTSSTSARLNSIETTSASVNTLNNVQNSRLSALETTSASVDTLNTTQNSRLDSLENLTGSFATTGSNTFYGQQVFSGSLYVQDNLIVQGSSSLQNITASAVSIGTNIVYLNTDTPAVRYAGLTVQDSGSSAGVTGSMLWDSLCNRWIYSNPSTIGYSGGMLLSGPRAANLGEETTLTCNFIAKSGGGDHLYNSCIYDNGTTTCFNTPTGSFSGILGIGITNPKTALHVSGTIAVGESSTGWGRLSFDSSTNNVKLQAAKDGTDLIGLSFWTQTSGGGFAERMIISGSNVGINCSTPSYNLDVSGCGRFYQPLSNSTSYLVVQNNRARNAAVYTATTNGGFYAGTSIGTDTFNYQIYDGVAGEARLTISSTGIASFACQICAPVASFKGSGQYNNVIVDNGCPQGGGGYLVQQNGVPAGGIGVSAWWEGGTSCDVGMGAYASRGIRFYTNAGSEKMRITSDGKIGIGTTSPAGFLEIKCTQTTYHRIVSCFEGSYTSGFAFSDLNGGLKYDAGGNTFCLYSNYPNYGGIILSTATIPRLTVHSCGAVQISGVAHKSYLLSDTTIQTPVPILQLDRNSMYVIEYASMHYGNGLSTNGWRYVQWHGYDGSGNAGQGGGCNFYMQVVQSTGTAESSATPSLFACVQDGRMYICYGNGYASYRQLNVRRLIDDGGNNASFL